MQLKIFLYFYLFLILLFSTYQDFIGFKYLGFLGQSPIVFLLPIFIIIELFYIKKKIFCKLYRLEKLLLIFILFSLLISVLNILILFLKGIYSVYGENILIKMFKNLVYYMVIFFYIRHIKFLLELINNKKHILYVIFFFTLFNFILMIYEYLHLPTALTFLHYTNPISGRIRLLTSESSYSGTIVIVLFSLCVYLLQNENSLFKKQLIGFIAFAFLCTYTFLTGSKGFLATLLVSLLMFILLSLKNLKKQVLTIIGCLALVSFLFYFGIIDNMKYALMKDVESYTSLTTRLGTILISLIVFVTHPFGVGFGSYMYYFLMNLEKAEIYTSRVLYSVFEHTSLNFNELQNFYYTNSGLSVKSWFFNGLMILGVFIIYFYYRLVKLYMFNHRYPAVIKFCSMFLIFSSIFYVSLDLKFEVWFYFSIVEYLNYNSKIRNRKEDLVDERYLRTT